jgi:mRNA interferase RelE/StbE
MAYAIDFVPSAAKALAKLPTKERERIRDAIDELRTTPRPHGSEKLANRDAYKLRVGNYRIIYELQDRVFVVLVLDVGNRREIYKRLKS